jgi:hypothetical protein
LKEVGKVTGGSKCLAMEKKNDGGKERYHILGPHIPLDKQCLQLQLQTKGGEGGEKAETAAVLHSSPFLPSYPFFLPFCWLVFPLPSLPPSHSASRLFGHLRWARQVADLRS